MDGGTGGAETALIRRSYDAAEINAVLNHPSVLPWVIVPGLTTLDMTPVVADRRNVLLMAEHGGLIFEHQLDGIFEVHAQFLPEGRGRHAVQAATEAVSWMFANTECQKVVTRVPDGNVAASALARRVGLKFEYSDPDAWPTDKGRVAVRWFSVSKADWLKRD
jgi:hypothetical protein